MIGNGRNQVLFVGEIVRRTRDTRKDDRIRSKNSRNRERKCSFRSWSLRKIWKNAVGGLWHARVSSSPKRKKKGILTICALHWPGESGPTEEFPDPLKANFDSWTGESWFGKKKRPAERVRPVTKAAKKTVVTDEQIETDGLDAFQSDDEVKLKKRQSMKALFLGKKLLT